MRTFRIEYREEKEKFTCFWQTPAQDEKEARRKFKNLAKRVLVKPEIIQITVLTN